ncbi:MAG: Imm1 family immunity protein [Deltaproteobacteria bacterium]|nr:Imm1 family immunity protein [Deltaproteobacteria bacterium]
MHVEWSTYTETFRRDISPETALAFLDDLHRQRLACHPMVLFWRDDGLEFGIVVATETSLLTFQAGVDPPYFTSKGALDAPGLNVCFANVATDYPPSSTISWESARRAAREFFTTFSRPTSVDWEDL